MMRFYLRSEVSVCILYIYLCTYRGVPLDHVIIQPARTSDAVRPLSPLLRPLPLHFGRFRSTAATIRTTAAALCTTAAALCQSPTVFGVCSALECTYGPP